MLSNLSPVHSTNKITEPIEVLTAKSGTIMLGRGEYFISVAGGGGAGGTSANGQLGGAGETTTPAGGKITVKALLSTVPYKVGTGGLTKANGGNGGASGSGGSVNIAGVGGGGGHASYFFVDDYYVISQGGGGGGGAGGSGNYGRWGGGGAGGGGGGWYYLDENAQETAYDGKNGGAWGGTDDGSGGAGTAGNTTHFSDVTSGAGGRGGYSGGFRGYGGAGAAGAGASGGGGAAGAGNHGSSYGGGGGGGAGGTKRAHGGYGGIGKANGSAASNPGGTASLSFDYKNRSVSNARGGDTGANGNTGWVYCFKYEDIKGIFDNGLITDVDVVAEDNAPLSDTIITYYIDGGGISEKESKKGGKQLYVDENAGETIVEDNGLLSDLEITTEDNGKLKTVMYVENQGMIL